MVGSEQVGLRAGVLLLLALLHCGEKPGGSEAKEGGGRGLFWLIVRGHMRAEVLGDRPVQLRLGSFTTWSRRKQTEDSALPT